MKRVLLLLTAGFFLLVDVLSNNTAFMKSWVDYRSKATSLVPSDNFLFGDLYNLCHLPQFRTPRFKYDDMRPAYQASTHTNGVALYSICDSYLVSYLNDSLLPHADSYKYTTWGQTKRFQLDPKRNNVLLLELVERNARTLLADTSFVYHHLEVVNNAADESKEGVAANGGKPLPWMDREFYTRIFNRNLEQNLEYNIFNYAFFRPFKEAKAIFNDRVLGRKNEEVVVSETRRQLYYPPTVDASLITSSFHPLAATQLDSLTTNLNIIRQHYRRLGFAEVVLALMPNPVTVLEPNLNGQHYNGLVPRLQQHPDLQMPVVDVYSHLVRIKDQPIFQTSDTHWSRAGFLTGLGLLDEMLVAQRTPDATPEVYIAAARPAKRPVVVAAITRPAVPQSPRTVLGTGADSAVRSEQYPQQRVLRDTGKAVVMGTVAMGSNGQAPSPQARGGAGTRTWPQDGRL